MTDVEEDGENFDWSFATQNITNDHPMKVCTERTSHCCYNFWFNCKEGLQYVLLGCHECCFNPKDGMCSSSNRWRILSTCNTLNLSVLWNGIRNTYQRWPASAVLSLLSIILFLFYLIFARVSPPGQDQNALVAEINSTFAKAGFLMLLTMFTVAGLFVTCGHEILNMFSASPVIFHTTEEGGTNGNNPEQESDDEEVIDIGAGMQTSDSVLHF